MTKQFRGLRSLKKDRHAKAYAASLFATAISHDGKTTYFNVPGTDCRIHTVEIIRTGSNRVICDCSRNKTPCSGQGKVVCYHSLAAVIYSASQRGNEVNVCDDESKADRLVNLGGEKFTLVGKDNVTRPMYVVVQPK
jgi:hypothetical protein